MHAHHKYNRENQVQDFKRLSCSRTLLGDHFGQNDEVHKRRKDDKCGSDGEEGVVVHVLAKSSHPRSDCARPFRMCLCFRFLRRLRCMMKKRCLVFNAPKSHGHAAKVTTSQNQPHDSTPKTQMAPTTTLPLLFSLVMSSHAAAVVTISNSSNFHSSLQLCLTDRLRRCISICNSRPSLVEGESPCQIHDTVDKIVFRAGHA